MTKLLVSYLLRFVVLVTILQTCFTECTKKRFCLLTSNDQCCKKSNQLRIRLIYYSSQKNNYYCHPLYGYKLNICESNYYGENCTNICISTDKYYCHPYTGAKICRLNYYGEDCSRNCTPTEKYYCHPLTGAKICKSNHYGENCNISCTSNQTYYCNENTGAKICRVNYYGEDCSKNCTPTKKYYCHPLTGAKICKSNHYGENCNISCTSNQTYYCHPNTGLKIGLCYSGCEGKDCESKIKSNTQSGTGALPDNSSSGEFQAGKDCKCKVESNAQSGTGALQNNSSAGAFQAVLVVSILFAIIIIILVLVIVYLCIKLRNLQVEFGRAESGVKFAPKKSGSKKQLMKEFDDIETHSENVQKNTSTTRPVTYLDVGEEGQENDKNRPLSEADYNESDAYYSGAAAARYVNINPKTKAAEPEYDRAPVTATSVKKSEQNHETPVPSFETTEMSDSPIYDA